MEPSSPAGAPSLAVVPPSRSPLASGSSSQDGCELASPPQEAPPPLARAGPCLELPSCPLVEEADPERCREPSRIVPNDLHQTPSANLINELNGVPERVTLSENILELGVPKEAVPPALEPASEEPEVECAPPAASVALPGSPSPPPRPPHSPLALPVALAPRLPPSPPRSPSPPLPPGGAPAALQGDLDRGESPKLILGEDAPNAKDELEVDGRPEEEEEELEEDDFQGLSAKTDPEEGGSACKALAFPSWATLDSVLT